MSNLYWPIYKNLETEVIKLSYDIHIDDNQLNVYSSKISDLILRAAAEIESISKELYKLNNGTKTKNIYYDEDAIKHLNQLWYLDKKVIIISSVNCFQTQKELYPFKKNEKKTSNNKMTYSWNNAYQNLKHDRANSLKFGSIKYLFDIMAALFILNLYFKSDEFDLQKDRKALNLPVNMGSDIFSIEVHHWRGHSSKGGYHKQDTFDECIYFIKAKDSFMERDNQEHYRLKEKQYQLFIEHPKVIQHIKTLKGNEKLSYEDIIKTIGKDEHNRIIKQSYEDYKHIDLEFEALINKHQI